MNEVWAGAFSLRARVADNLRDRNGYFGEKIVNLREKIANLGVCSA